MQLLQQTYLTTPHRVYTNILNFLRMKDRYIRKRNGSLRVRCKATITASILALILVTSLQAFETYNGINFDINYAEKLFAQKDIKETNAPISNKVARNSVQIASLAIDNTDANIDNDESQFLHNYKRIREALSNEKKIKAKFAPKIINVTIKKGDTLAGALQRNGVSGGDAYTVVKSMTKHFDPRLIRPGQKLKLTISPHDGEMAFSRMDFITDPIRTIVIERDKDGVISSQVLQKEIIPQMYAAKATIENSLYGSALKQGVPEPIVAQAIRILSWSIDFQREIRAGDELQVLYDVYMTDDGDYVRSGEPYYIRLTQKNNELALYLHEFPDGRTGYFRENGHSAKKGLLRTLVDGARISSGYGRRKHPVLGYGKMHKGIDFAAPRGTPVYAAGDGVIKKAGRFSSYGNYIKIRHNSRLETAYAHLKSYAKNVKAGKRVKQGQIIGYVGTTGRSTGPHLHYEVLVNGSQANPRSVKVPTGEVLSGGKLAKLKKTIRKYDRQFASLLGRQKLASRKDDSKNKLN